MCYLKLIASAFFLSIIERTVRSSFSPWTKGFPPSSEINTFKFQFNMETVAEEPLRAMYHCKFQISFLFLFHFIFYLFIVGNVGITAGLSFEAGAQMYCPVISHSISGTLIPIFGSFF